MDEICFEEHDHSMDIPLYHFGVAINALSQNNQSYKNRPCIACNGAGHSFENCPILQDKPKVARAYGRLLHAVQRACRTADSIHHDLRNPTEAPSEAPIQAINSVGSPAASTLTGPPSMAAPPVSTRSFALPTHALEIFRDDSTSGSDTDDSSMTDYGQHHFGFPGC